MAKIHKVLLERPYTPSEEIIVLEGPTGRELFSMAKRDPHLSLRFSLASGRMFVAPSRLLHKEMMRLVFELGVVVTAEGGITWDEEASVFLVHFNNSDGIGPATIERAFWRAFEPYRPFGCQVETGASDAEGFERHERTWRPLVPYMSQTTRRHDEHHAERVAAVHARLARAPLEALVSELTENPATNWSAMLLDKAGLALARDDLRVWVDTNWSTTRIARISHETRDRMRVEIGERTAFVDLETHSEPHPLFRRMHVDCFEIAHPSGTWSDGEPLDPVDRILVVSELAIVRAASGRDLVLPEEAPARREEARERAERVAEEIRDLWARTPRREISSRDEPAPWSR